MNPLDVLRQQHPWPSFPALPRPIPDLTRGNIVKGLDKVIDIVRGRRKPIIIEVGSKLGGGARAFVKGLDNPTVIGLDKWPVRGYSQPKDWAVALKDITNNPKFGTLAVFSHLCRDYQRNITCMKGDRLESLKEIHQFGIQPDMVYVDCLHLYKPLLADLRLVHSLFPKAIISGDDWRIDPRKKYPIQRAVKDFAKEFGFDFINYDNQFVILKKGWLL